MGYSPWGCKESDTTEVTKDIISRYVDPLLKSVSPFMIPERKRQLVPLGWGEPL